MATAIKKVRAARAPRGVGDVSESASLEFLLEFLVHRDNRGDHHWAV
jgi:hypothetical protein